MVRPMTATLAAGDGWVSAPAVLTPSEVESFHVQLCDEIANHAIWSCRLLTHCEAGHFTREDFAFLFSQYYRYCVDFTKYLAAVMTRCPSDYFRARLAQNIWEQGGMLEPEDRHAEIFRDFLRRGLGVEPSAIQFESFAESFAARYHAECLGRSPASAAAFLALGTESIISRLYAVFHRGLKRAGLAEDTLRFFAIHIACDDGHAATLTDLTCSYSGEPAWAPAVRDGVRAALDLRLAFFDDLFDAIAHRRIGRLLDAIQAKKSLAPASPDPGAVVFTSQRRGGALYANRIDRLNVEFFVERLPFAAEVLDPRLVRIPAHRCNERHKHAHETVFVIVRGHGRVLVDDTWYSVREGDYVFVPRWALHQSQNLGDDEMVILAITDFGLTGKAFIGDYLRTARMKDLEQAGYSTDRELAGKDARA